ncbi:glycosyltransferase family 4 protein [Azohydromonas caseinilytica]|uniref:Glycosyltransferase family 1 protein n=1 Tax=Azohydromonas caseinilytica TaxID=2728836 RepID=A0A848F480_9BURK|nr:glycosyltransferase family 1 protein [Azohydromonas caseinilytica]NML13525.1 glycosyltransferase family 1 protein [Azohydromonas caseinilytica]
MRIAYVTETYPPELNGVALTTERAVRFLREGGHEVQLVRPRQRAEAPRDDAQEWRALGIPIPMYPALRFGMARMGRFVEHWRDWRPHLVHVATPGPLGHAAVHAARRLGLTVTADFRTNFHHYSRYYRMGWAEPLIAACLRRFHNEASCCFVPTQALARQLRLNGFQRVEVQGRGVDTELFSPERRSDALRARWNATDPRQVVMLYVGRLAAEKNVLLALRAFQAARRLRPLTRMVVVGDGPLRARLERDFPAAEFVGPQHGEALAAHYASADLFLFPSQSETFGNVTLEALASGLAVVAIDLAAAAQHIESGVSGLLVPPDDEEAFIRTAIRAAEMGELLAPLRHAARQAALQVRWEQVLSRFEQRLAQLALQPLPGRVPHVAMA